MNEAYLKNVIEAALFAAGRPLMVSQIAQLFDEHVRPSTAEVRAQLERSWPRTTRRAASR